MKKSLIALAVLAATGAAMAQSSVTLFGRLDAGVGVIDKETTGAAPVASQSQTVVNSSTFNTTYWGMKGTEDLGGGLKANFNLQSGFAIDTGVGNTGLFERLATVGLSGGFGAVNLGRQYSPYYDLFGATDNIDDANVATTGAVYGKGIGQSTVTRASNSIRYDSPSFSGLSVSALVGLGENENVAPNVGDATNIFSLNIIYKAGPLLVGYAHHQEKLTQAVLTTPQDENTYDMVGATFDFGMAKVTGGYQQVSNDSGTDDKEFNAGVKVPVGTAATVYLGYADSNTSKAGFDLNSQGYTLAGTYNMSKRTKLYASYDATELEKGTPGAVSTDETSRFAVGVVHLF
ncbi:porin [Rhodoferax sp.]|uniref:porin n=1 Tax=Rhodoferax sp. TaxID=50421 RepID=UPI0026105541|nr:porin [Rhodoferax sp.]MDD2918926.1 porin [Rhodoferax sp.]